MPRARKTAPAVVEQTQAPDAVSGPLSDIPRHEPPPRPKGGHPLYLTDERRAAMLHAIELGLPIEKAATLIGIAPRTWRDWLQRAKDPEAHAYWQQLGLEIDQAKARCMQRRLEQIEAAAQDPKHWTAAAWHLERADPENFGRNAHVTIDVRKLSDQEFIDAIAEAGLSGLLERPDQDGTLAGGGAARLQSQP